MESHGQSHYKSLVLEVGLHFVIMYAVMYTMVDTFADVYLNINNFYMTGMMVLPMISLMLISMRSMFKNKKVNALLHTISIALFLILFSFMRNQTFVGDRGFVTSMIPHHSGAILMCEEATIKDEELKRLCIDIVVNQKREIEQLKEILKRLKQE